MIHWDSVRYFVPKEFEDPSVVDSGELIDGVTLLLLDRLRHEIGCPIIVHAAVDVNGTHGHAINSYHLVKSGCTAVDFHFDTTCTLKEQFYDVINSGFDGIGFYPEWGNPGFHVDIRGHKNTSLWIKRWGKYYYII